MKSYIFILALALLAPCTQCFAQRKKQQAKVVLPKEDLSIYTDNPVCKVVIVDSTVVAINEITKKIPMPAHMGRFFSSIDNGGLIMYENEFADTRLYAVSDTSRHHNLYRQTLLDNKWSEPELLHINGDFLDLINPILMPDGQTLYFAARSADDNDGKTFSLYTTTFDTETASYLTPEKLPFPFVSNDNDLYYIEDEADSIAWLVTTRRQPTGMACIYTMRNSQPWSFYDSEETPAQKLKSLALISNISETWTSKADCDAILREMKQSLDDNTYVQTGNSAKESEHRRNIRQKIEDIHRKLDQYRALYFKSTDEQRSQLANIIRETEHEIRQLYTELKKL